VRIVVNSSGVEFERLLRDRSEETMRGMGDGWVMGGLRAGVSSPSTEVASQQLNVLRKEAVIIVSYVLSNTFLFSMSDNTLSTTSASAMRSICYTSK